jgi:ADP-ribose pyrophosphatase YjhB (NUDIX family)
LHVAADIKAAFEESTELRRERGHFVQEWMDNIGEGIPGYVTPKVAIGAIVGNDAGEILLVKRAPSGVWLYPTGWADVGYSAAEVVVKEVREETGIEAEPVQLLGVVDGMRMGFTKFGMYMLLFHCRATGGELNPHPLETDGCGWFAKDQLPQVTAGAEWWAERAFAAINGEVFTASFDAPRSPMWRGTPAE